MQVNIAAEENLTAGESESCGCYWTGDRRTAIYIKKREMEVFGTKVRRKMRDHTFSDTRGAEDNTAVEANSSRKVESRKRCKGGDEAGETNEKR